jgi:hypothetical protein
MFSQLSEAKIPVTLIAKCSKSKVKSALAVFKVCDEAKC